MSRSPIRRSAVLLLALGLALLAGRGLVAQGEGGAVVLDIKGAIGPATSDYVHRGLEKARQQGARLVVLRMDTPGGLDSAMRAIIQDILTSPIPIATYVAPSGARAASAGTYILYASHVAAMAPGTTLGSATPVQIGGTPEEAERLGLAAQEAEPDDVAEPDAEEPAAEDDEEQPAPARRPGMAEKVIEDAAAYIRGLAELRGRNAEWAERAVREAVSESSRQALELNIIDVVARDLDDLLAQIDGRVVEVPQGEVTLATEEIAVEVIEPDWRTRLLSVITDPNVAYILMIVGIYGIIFEFYNPGMFVPGVAGAICLLLALYAFQVLPVNYAGIGLMVLGIGLLLAEAFMPSFGVLGIGGMIAFVAGSILLIDTDVPGFGISWYLIGVVAAANAGFFLFVVGMAMRSWKRQVVSGREAMIGSLGRVVDWSGGEGRVRLQGEVWNARAVLPMQPGALVRVTGADGLMLDVEPANP